MNYEQKYKAALDWIRSIYPTMQGAEKEDAEHYFPELRESEDEKIRKELIDIVKKSPITFAFDNKDKVLSWLEKQCKKSVVWSEEDEKIRKAQLNYWRSVGGKEWYGVPVQETIAWLEKQGEQKPSWSEEDEKLYNWCLACIQTRYNDGFFTKSEYNRTKLWLKSLKDRIQPQPKQEWSDEDEENLNNVVKELDITKRSRDKILYAQYDKLIDWLKSIKSNHWKPSEEQMKEALQTEYEKGRFDMREEMMKDAVEGTVKYRIGSAEIPQCDRRYQVLSDQTPIANAKLGDKVKIIICKTEQQ